MRKMGKILLTAGFSFFLFLHHPQKRLENISIFFIFPSSARQPKSYSYVEEIFEGHLPSPLLVTAKLRLWEHEVDH
jgi:hypothetical protein